MPPSSPSHCIRSLLSFSVYPVDCCVDILSLAATTRLLFRPEAKCPLEPSSAHLWAAVTVIATAVATESTPPPLTPVAETFVMVVVGFGRDWGGWGRYLEAAGHGRGGRCVVRWYFMCEG
eukprot:scaffold9965_cov69-Cyclotella_meneghiniana.AAC.21